MRNLFVFILMLLMVGCGGDIIKYDGLTICFDEWEDGSTEKYPEVDYYTLMNAVNPIVIERDALWIDMKAELASTRGFESNRRIEIMKNYGARPAHAARANKIFETLGVPEGTAQDLNNLYQWSTFCGLEKYSPTVD